MKIAINALPYTSYQGIENFLVGLLRAWPKSEDIITVFANEKSAAFLTDLPPYIKIEIKKFTKTTRLRLFYYQQFVLPQILKKEKFDIIFCPSLESSWLFSKKIVTIHDAAPFVLENENSFIGKIYWQSCLFFAKHFSLGIVTVSEFSRQELITSLGIKAEKIKIIYNAPPILSAANIQNYTEIKKITNPYIITVGNARPRKNLDALLSAYQQISTKRPDYKLLIIGKMDKEMEKLKAKNIPGIIFTGFIDEKEKCRLLAGAKLLVLPSLYEGFGVPILEAQNLKIPVICTDITAFREAAGAAALFFDKNKATDIANKIENLLDNPALAEELSVKGKINTQRFSWTDSNARLITLIHQHENITDK
jgi:glycosyltransferase involved in cell wall biosynthesis